MKEIHVCECCGVNYDFSEDNICPNCKWESENIVTDENSPDEFNGGMSLQEYRYKFLCGEDE